MPVATPKQYEAMLDAAQKGNYAYPAVNVTSLTTINAALKAFSDAKSDGIIQVSTGGGQFASGLNVADAAFGAIVLAEATHILASKHDVLVALHTDHCHPEKVDGFLKPLLEASLYTTPEDMVEVYEALQPIGRFIFAATFGNVHGAYKPGAVKLEPTILRDGQKAVTDKHGEDAFMELVFHGGSGSDLNDIRETLDYGVIKMNIDTDTQYAFTRPIVSHIGENIEGVLKIDGEVGNKKTYDPRSYLKKGEKSMAARMQQACEDLRSNEKSIFGTV